MNNESNVVGMSAKPQKTRGLARFRRHHGAVLAKEATGNRVTIFGRKGDKNAWPGLSKGVQETIPAAEKFRDALEGTEAASNKVTGSQLRLDAVARQISRRQENAQQRYNRLLVYSIL